MVMAFSPPRPTAAKYTPSAHVAFIAKLPDPDNAIVAAGSKIASIADRLAAVIETPAAHSVLRRRRTAIHDDYRHYVERAQVFFDDVARPETHAETDAELSSQLAAHWERLAGRPFALPPWSRSAR